MIRDTSIATFNHIRTSGLLSNKRLEVYSILFEHGPLTGAQVAQRTASSSRYSESVRNRLTELRDMGAVTELGDTNCPITGNKVILWDVTSKIPIKFKPKLSKNQQTIKELKDENKALRAVCRRLRNIIKKP